MPIPERLDGTVILVTGASAGLGRALALTAGARGATVVLLARGSARLEALATEIERAGGIALPTPTDVRHAEAVARAFRTIDERCPRLDLVVHCAGVLEPIGPQETLDPEEMRASLEVNVLGAFLVTRAAIAAMRARPPGGTLIHVTSGAASKPYRGWSAYCSGKAALDMLMRCAAAEAVGTPVRIMAVNPGPFESAMQELIRCTDADRFPARERFQQLHDTGRLPAPRTIAEIVLDLGLAAWPELAGEIADLRSPAFRAACIERGIATIEPPGPGADGDGGDSDHLDGGDSDRGAGGRRS
ncbi:MAG: SDR family NAD(P)-dependent oxidoreductase [Candidatus Eiseniibacteriota bacterium]|jgi:NAD(P)-dependent dehydrogenase (short-subunit alcohol dehydrogenase family)